MIAVAFVQRINLLDPVILAYVLGVTGFIAAVMFAFSRMQQTQIQTISNVAANVILFGVISGFILMAAVKKVNCPWPLAARYKGAGDTNDAGNFACVK